MGCLHDPANVQQTFSKCIQNTRANAGLLLDRVNTLSTLRSALQRALQRVGKGGDIFWEEY